MSNKFLGYLFVSVILVLIVSVYVQSIGMAKALRKYSQVSTQLKKTYKLDQCQIVPKYHNELGNGLELSWQKKIDVEEKEEALYQEELLGQRLALHSMSLLHPAPQFVKLLGPQQKILIKTTQETTFFREYIDIVSKKP